MFISNGMIDSQQLHTSHHPESPAPVPRASLPSLNTKPPHQMPRRHHRIRWTILGVALVAIVLLGLAGWVAYRAVSVINTKRLDGSRLSFFQQLTHIVTSGGEQLQGEKEDRVNILLLGYGGPGHDGPYLTDTMMLVSVEPSTKKVALLSIPRDLVVDIPGYDYRKINSVLSFGRDSKYPGGGEALTVKVVSDLLNLPIQYYARVDFDGFIDVIDQVNGVNVTVDTTFSDYMYPDNNYGYDPISFKAGPQIMDGTKALKFSRSRHGNNGEGSDFARAARQQKVIIALKDKLLSFGVLANPKKISDVLGSLGSHSQTNMEVWEMFRLAKIAGSVQSDQIINKVFDDRPDGFLRAATGSGGAFILLPLSGHYDNMQFLAQHIFLDGQADGESATVLVVNASKYASLGATIKQVLEAMGITVAQAQTLSDISIKQSILVSAKPGQYPATEKLLSLFIHAAGTIDLANWTSQTGDPTLAQAFSRPIPINANRATNTTQSTSLIPDLIVVLGDDQPKPAVSPATTSTTNTSRTTTTNTKSTNTNSTNSNTTNTNTTATNTSTNTNTATTNTSTNKNTNATTVKNTNSSP